MSDVIEIDDGGWLLVYTRGDGGARYRTDFMRTRDGRAELKDRVRVTYHDGIRAPRQHTEPAENRITDSVAALVRDKGYTPTNTNNAANTDTEGS